MFRKWKLSLFNLELLLARSHTLFSEGMTKLQPKIIVIKISDLIKEKLDTNFLKKDWTSLGAPTH